MKTETKSIQAYDKIDHTICLNFNDGNLKFGLDTYGDGPDGGPCDCKNIEEAVTCLGFIYKRLKASDIMIAKTVQIELIRCCNSAHDYNVHSDRTGMPLTIQEFKTVKEVVSCPIY